MTRIHSIALAVALATAGLSAQAQDKAQPSIADKAKAAAAEVKQSIAQATLCDACGTVSEVKTEKRKGKGSGVGAVGGAVAGGVVGNKTTDSTIGTVGGAAVGGLLGNEIEKRVKRRTVWVTSVKMKDGSTKRFEAEADPGWKAGDVLEVGADNKPKKRG
jgi:outer membrane lipoprotein SlyB